MEKGTKLIYASLGFEADGTPTHDSYSQELKFDQFIDDKIMGITKEGFIRIIDPEKCKILDTDMYFTEHDNPLLG